MGKTRRRIGSAMQTFGELLGPALQQKREFELQQKRDDEATRQFDLTHALAELYRAGQIEALGAESDLDRTEAQLRQAFMDSIGVGRGDGVTRRQSPVTTSEYLETAPTRKGLRYIAEPGGKRLGAYGPPDTSRFDTGPTATFPLETMTRQELGPVKLGPLQVERPRLPMDEAIESLRQMEGSGRPGTNAFDLISDYDRDALSSLQTDTTASVMRGLGGDESDRWGTIYAPLDQPGGSLPPLTQDQLRRLMLENLGMSAAGILGGVYADPESQAKAARLAEEERAGVGLRERRIAGAQDELAGAGGLTTFEQRDPATGDTVVNIVPTTSLTRQLVTGATPGAGGMSFLAPFSAGQQTALSQLGPMWESVSDIQGLYDEFEKRSTENIWGFEKGMVGPWAGRAGSVMQQLPGDLGLDDPLFSRLNVGLNTLLNNTVRAITGAQMSNPEAVRIMGQVPLVTDRWSVFKEKLAATARNLRAMQESIRMQKNLDDYWEDPNRPEDRTRPVSDVTDPAVLMRALAGAGVSEETLAAAGISIAALSSATAPARRALVIEPLP